jgi:hypothetical protein
VLALMFTPTRTWSRITPGSPIATLYVKFIGSRGLSRHDPWTLRFGYQASRGRFVRPCDPSRRSRDCRKGRYRTVTGPPAKSGRQPPMRRSVRSSRSQVIRPDRFGGRCVIDSATAEQCPSSSAVARQFLHFEQSSSFEARKLLLPRATMWKQSNMEPWRGPSCILHPLGGSSGRQGIRRSPPLKSRRVDKLSGSWGKGPCAGAFAFS